jgi:hypothetical protein
MAHLLVRLRANKIVGWRMRSLQAGQPGEPVAYSAASPAFLKVEKHDVLWVLALLDLPQGGRIPTLVARIEVAARYRTRQEAIRKHRRSLWEFYGRSWVPNGKRMPVVAEAAPGESFLSPFFDVSEWLRGLRFPPTQGSRKVPARLDVPRPAQASRRSAWTRLAQQLRVARRIEAPDEEAWRRNGLVPRDGRGDAVFLTYKWAEGRAHALVLARELARRGRQVWLDSLVLPGTRKGIPRERLEMLIETGLERSVRVVALRGDRYDQDLRPALADADRRIWVRWEREAAARQGLPVSDLNIRSRPPSAGWLKDALAELGERCGRVRFL